MKGKVHLLKILLLSSVIFLYLLLISRILLRSNENKGDISNPDISKERKTEGQT
jgi:hypothetical protein